MTATKDSAEVRQLPALAKTAAMLLRQQYQTNLNGIAKQAVEALGLDPQDNWSVDFDAGIVARKAQ